MSTHEITFNTNRSEPLRTRADFTYRISPTVISIVAPASARAPVTDDIEAVLRKIEYWHQGPISSFKIMCRDGRGFWQGGSVDDKTASCLALNETDERKALKKL
jgi:hypothetical protein